MLVLKKITNQVGVPGLWEEDQISLSGYHSVSYKTIMAVKLWSHFVLVVRVGET